MRILMIVLPDPHPASDDNAPVRRIIEPYYIFKDLGVEVDVATLSGGPVWSRREQSAMGKGGSMLQRFLADRSARDLFADGLQIDQIAADDFQAAFCTSIPMQDAADPEPASTVLSTFFAGARPVALVAARVELAELANAGGLCLLGGTQARPAHAARTLVSMLADHADGKEMAPP